MTKVDLVNHDQVIDMQPQFLEQDLQSTIIWKFYPGGKLTGLWSKVIMAWLATVRIINKRITVVITVTDTGGVTNLHHYKEFSSRELKVV